jgi:hypothetical protein
MELEAKEIMVSLPATDLERVIVNLEKMKTKTFLKKNTA